jgi:DNA-binding NarL/FixJ family response regulator
MKIVIVDDDESMRAVLRALCISEGHEVTAEFGDGNGLLSHVFQHHPDVLCLDFNLPGANGLELLTLIDTNANQVDVVMITGSDDPELKGKAADAGATGFIRKPFEQAQIIDELRAIEQTRRIAARAAETPAGPETLEAEPATATEPESNAVTVAVAVVPRTAVVVDDSGSVRLLLKGILEEAGIKVVGLAANGHEGVEAVKKTHPALVCLDVDMPGMTGLEALPQVRAASPQTKVVMITGNAGRPVVEAAVAGGARGYFLKPIRPAKVEEFMRKLLTR